MATIGQDIDYAGRLLAQGEVVAIPTETVYGLAANALDANAVAKIFAVKNRPYFDPLIVHVASWEEAKRYVKDLPPQAEQLANRFWPGPLTLLLPKKNIVPDLVTSGLDRVGIRCPAHPLTLKLLNTVSFPLAAPSANPFGYVSPTTAQHVQDQLGDKIPYILDGGQCTVGIESTILGWEGQQPVIYRLGGVNQEGLEDILGSVQVQTHSSSNPQAPGQLISHYAPNKKFLFGELNELVARNPFGKAGILAFQRKISGVDPSRQLLLSPSGDLNEAARNLFSMLRRLDAMEIDGVLAEAVPETGLGRAINDRLRRAASKGQG